MRPKDFFALGGWDDIIFQLTKDFYISFFNYIVTSAICLVSHLFNMRGKTTMVPRADCPKTTEEAIKHDITPSVPKYMTFFYF